MSTHNICFRREIRKILCGYPLLSVAMEYAQEDPPACKRKYRYMYNIEFILLIPWFCQEHTFLEALVFYVDWHILQMIFKCDLLLLCPRHFQCPSHT